MALGPFGSFVTKDINDETVTADILKDYDITMVNIWTTWCGACVSEMGELQKTYKAALEEKDIKLNMISICGDLDESKDMAKEIITANGCDFKVIAPDETIETNVLNNIEYIPTTFFVDSKGNIIGDPIVGVPPSKD
ncbi:MAG: TlpA disulfide reductase family protein, partial [Oscillospiraceae bacterium]